MSDKQKRAINRGRVNAGLKPIKFKKTAKTNNGSTGRTRERFRDKWTKKKYVIIPLYIMIVQMLNFFLMER